jgi:hydroxyacylglutathione hydrolase
MEILQVRGNTFCFDTGMTYIPFYKINEEEIIILDSGWAEGEREGIEELFKINNFKVVGIISSHAHIDHIGNNAYLKNKYNCIIAMPAYEALVCSSTVNLKVYYHSQTLSDVKEHFGHMVCETDILISDSQDKLLICGTKFRIVHTPGHSPAHICIVTPDNVAYLGDALISYEVMKGAKMPYAFILREDLKSKGKLLELKCRNYIIAHKGISNDITQLVADNISFYKNRAKTIYEIIEGSMTKEDILKAVIKKFNLHVETTYKYIVMERMLWSYIEYLNEIGLIDLKIENGFLKYIKHEELIWLKNHKYFI